MTKPKAKAKNAVRFLQELLDKIEAGTAEVSLVTQDVKFSGEDKAVMRVDMHLKWKEDAPR